MAYLCPIHRPSSVRHAIKLNLLAPDEECLVLGKANRIEIWTQSPHADGLVLAHSKAIYGRITILQKLELPDLPTHHLFIGTERSQYFVAQWNAGSRQLETTQSFVDVSERNTRDSQTLDRCLVDPTGRYIAMHLHEGMLSLVNIIKPRKGSTEYLDTPQQVRIADPRVWSSTFLHTKSKQPKLAMLVQRRLGDREVVTYRLTDEKGKFSQFEKKRDEENHYYGLEYGASMLIPVPSPECSVEVNTTTEAWVGGFIVVGESTMTYIDDSNDAMVKATITKSIYVAWEKVDPLQYLLADDHGMLYFFTLRTDGNIVTGIDEKRLGMASTASVLVYLGYNIVYIGSHEGDCQVVRLHLDNDEGDCVEVVQTMANIAPILDFSIMDLGSRSSAHTSEFSSGQARLVTGSGVFQNGSLRSVRSGVGMEDIGVLGEMENIRGIYSVKSHGAAQVDTLVVSFITETRVFRFEASGEIEEVESFAGLSMDEHTLWASNPAEGRILQVLSSGVIIVDAESSMAVASWKPAAGQSITAVSANDSYVLLSVDGKVLLSLDLRHNLKEVAREDLGSSDQVSCVYVPSIYTDIGLVGFWKSGTVSIVALNTLKVIHGESVRSVDNAAIPRSIILAQVLPETVSGPTLFVAMMDGVVHTFDVDRATYALSGKKSIVLGTQEAIFQLLPGNEPGISNIFATCDHPSYIYGSENRIVYSAVTAETATYICPFDSEAYPGSVIMATSSDIRISIIDTERRTHVRTLPMGETIRRIAYSPIERVFGIGSIARRDTSSPVDAPQSSFDWNNDVSQSETFSSSFRLVDEVNFANLGEPINLAKVGKDQLQWPELVETVVRAELEDHNGELAERFIVGTSALAELPPDEVAQYSSEPRGRILVFGVDSNRSPYFIASRSIKGACRRLGIVEGKIVAALVKTVVVYDYIETARTTATFSKRATYRTSTMPLDLAINGDVIAVADMMQSVSLLQFKKGTQGLPDELVEIGRPSQSTYSSAVAHLENESYLEADAFGNLVILRRNIEGALEDDRKKLEVTSEMNLGEPVNHIETINVDVGPNAAVIPKAFLATTEGSIHLIGLIAPSYLDLLLRLQARLASSNLIHTLGGLPWGLYRGVNAPHRQTEEPYRFVDGELIERFLDLRESDQSTIAEGLGPSLESLRTLVESLRRLA